MLARYIEDKVISVNRCDTLMPVVKCLKHINYGCF